MRRSLTVLALALAMAAAPLGAAAYTPPSAGTAWLPAGADADIDRAFAQARAEKKPLLLYWGASWCPYCSQLKATLFNRQDFIERSKSFVAVAVDGDLPGAQRLGSRFKVRGYPTLILFSADGREITRLPGEAEAAQVMAVLQLGMSGGRAAAAVLADARAGKPLSADDWRMLAFYSWSTDEQQLVAPADRPALLASLARAAPDDTVATRFWLKALAESDDGKGIKADAALKERVRRVVADAQASRAQMDVLVNDTPDIVRALDTAAADRPLFDRALARLQADATLSRADRLSALAGRIELARLDAPKEAATVPMPAPLAKALREQIARDDREITDRYERQAVVTAAAHVLGRAGLWAESDALLQANLGKTNAPYYLMSQLGGNAKKRGDKALALRWYEQAYDRSEGPATRLQWGGGYLANLIELAPQDAARIEKTAAKLFAEAAADDSAFHERSARSLQRAGARLLSWNLMGDHDSVLKRLRAQLAPVCVRQRDAVERAACENVLKPRDI